MKIQKTYAGIGSRRTPAKIIKIMRKLGQALASRGWSLRTGNCCGADQAFQAGANSVLPELVEIYLPWQSYEANFIKSGNTVHTPSRRSYKVASEHHPAWHRCSDAAKAMHARNVEIVLGAGLDKPVQAVV